MSKPRIAFLGLGIMGSGMARRLLTNGFPLTVFNRNVEKAKPFANDGATIADSARAAAAEAQVVISMVADDDASRAMWLDEHGAFAGVGRGTVCIECSTVTVGLIRKLAAIAKQKKCDFLDCPVTGSKVHSEAGELNFLVGGESDVLEKARPVLATMSKTITLLGPNGSGALVKLINNFVCGVQVAALAEALAMIEHSGLDRGKSLEVLTNGAPGSPLVKMVSARMTARDYTPNFLLKLMAKDLRYALQEGRNSSLELETAAIALKKFQSAISANLGDKDMAAVVETLRDR
jgi:3-hydroxyisobutyrate dehydrogenase